MQLTFPLPNNDISKHRTGPLPAEGKGSLRLASVASHCFFAPLVPACELTAECIYHGCWDANVPGGFMVCVFMMKENTAPGFQPCPLVIEEFYK